jgi:hypothetical protein
MVTFTKIALLHQLRLSRNERRPSPMETSLSQVVALVLLTIARQSRVLKILLCLSIVKFIEHAVIRVTFLFCLRLHAVHSPRQEMKLVLQMISSCGR